MKLLMAILLMGCLNFTDTPNHFENVDTSFKAYMDYQTITDTTSTQYELQKSAYTDENGLRVIYHDVHGELYMVALGSFWADKCGYVVEIGLDTGETIKAVVGDLKQDTHTNETNQWAVVRGDVVNVVEFIVEQNELPRKTQILGSVNNIIPGRVTYIKTIDFLC